MIDREMIMMDVESAFCILDYAFSSFSTPTTASTLGWSDELPSEIFFLSHVAARERVEAELKRCTLALFYTPPPPPPLNEY
jgi:hypothetical protein